MKHVTVYREPGRFAGWPANYGIWSWGDEIVLGFTVGHFSTQGGFHYRDRGKPFTGRQARSTDGGETWDVGEPPFRSPGGRGVSADEHMEPRLHVAEAIRQGDAPADSPGGIDFARPGFALMCARTGLRGGAQSFFYYSYDRCRSWDGPFWLPMFEQEGIAARTDYIVDGPGQCTLFLTGTKPGGAEGRTFCARTEDGGKTFSFLSFVGPEEPEGSTLMPSSLRLPDGRVLSALRRHGDGRFWIDLFVSEDDCRSWRLLSTPVPSTGQNGNPPALIRLTDGRLCLTFGYRDSPQGIRARLSGDDGATWSDEIVLRDDGGNPDLGYTRTVQRADGRIVTAYYFNERPEGDRYIAATIWRP